MTVDFITHPDCARHDMGAGHPECPNRLQAIRDELSASALDELLQMHTAPTASREQLSRVHDADYVDAIFAAAPQKGTVQLDPDTSMNPHSLSAALHAAGAVVLAVDRVLRGEAKRAFCSVRPPGHHAEHNRAMGFCLFNNVAVGAAHALSKYGLQRVAIVDFDVHHGNGTEDIFRNEDRILFCSSFQHPFYPYTDISRPARNCVHAPLPAGTDGGGFRAAIREHWLPALAAFEPELIFCSAGFDAHREDPLAGLNLDESDYTWVTQQIRALADTHSQGRIISTLEGGYALAALGRSAAAHIRVLLDRELDN